MSDDISTIKIGPAEKELWAADSQWVHQTIVHLTKEKGATPCIRISIREPGLRVNLVTCNCSGGVGGGRPPTPAEREILDLWGRLRLDEPDCDPQNVWAFIQQLKRAA